MSFEQIVEKFMERCKRKCGFRLPVIYPHYVADSLDPNIIDTVIYHNNIDMRGA